MNGEKTRTPSPHGRAAASPHATRRATALVLAALLLLTAGQALATRADLQLGNAPMSQSADQSADQSVDQPTGGVSAEPGNSYWPDRAPTEEEIGAVRWQAESSGAVVSVSPSGQHALVMNRDRQERAQSNSSGFNKLGRQVLDITLYSRRGDTYVEASRIDIAGVASTRFQDTLAVTAMDGVAWSEDETRLLVTLGYSAALQSMLGTRSDLYLIDFAAKTFENLTGNDALPGGMQDGHAHHLLPKLRAQDCFTFVRYTLLADRRLSADLMQIDLSTGTQKRLADLSDEGRMTPITDYAVSSDAVYFTRGTFTPGFCMAKLDGAKTPPTQLLNPKRLNTDGTHPTLRDFTSVQVSQDGRWALLSVSDLRMQIRDIPFAEDASAPWVDPRTTTSRVTKQAWAACHNVLLYDLERRALVDVFTAEALQPYTAIVVGATFAPDGKSLLCAVLGDGGIWLADDFFKQMTLYQVRLDDGSFDALRVLRTAFSTNIAEINLAWLSGHDVLLTVPFAASMQQGMLLSPQAFAWFADGE